MSKKLLWSKSRMPMHANRDFHPAFTRDLQNITVLTLEEVIALERVIQSGLRRILALAPDKKINFEKVNCSEVIKSFRKREREAFNEMVVRNLRMVMSISKHFGYSHMSASDLVGYGIEGLMIAILRFESERGLHFSTYATYWIRHYIRRAVQNLGGTVRMPPYMYDERCKIMRNEAVLGNKLGRAPTISELAKFIKMPKRDLEKIVARMVAIFSLNVKVHHEGYEIEYQDMTPDETVRDPADEAIGNLDIAKLNRALDEVLDERERAVLRLRFHADMTLKEIGENSVGSIQEGRSGRGLSRERIRQIQEQALKKLRMALTENDPESEELEEEDGLRQSPLRSSYMH